MRRFVSSLVLLLACTTSAFAQQGMGRTPAAPGMPLFAQLLSVEGLPADSTIRREFAAGLREVFAEDRHASERDGGGGWQPSTALPNRFRLLEGTPADDAWNVQIVLGAPAPAVVQKRASQGDGAKRRSEKSRRASRGMIVSVTALSPEARQNGARALPVTVAFAFPAPPPPADASQVVTSSGYEYSWAKAGRCAGLLALEVLHHGSGDLRENERFDLAPAVRTSTGR
ncbi:MAG: hypothetical protein U0704_11475 [Candidatus Eisenbacteria bacterium]